MDLGDISAAYNGLKMGKDLLKSMLDSKIEAQARQRVNEVLEKLGQAQDTLFSMREALFRLQSDNESLRRQVEQADDWKSVIDQYELVETSGKAVVYKSKNKPFHYLCPSCAENKQRQILQDNRTYSGKFTCVACQAKYPIKPSKPDPNFEIPPVTSF